MACRHNLTVRITWGGSNQGHQGNIISISIWPHLFLYSKKRPKMVPLPEKRMELCPETHIYLESISPGKHYKYINMATPLSVFKERPKMVTLPRTKWSYRPKTLSCKHNLTANNMEWVSSGHFSSSVCVRLKLSKMVHLKKHFDLSCVHFCIKSQKHVSKVDSLVTTAHFLT